MRDLLKTYKALSDCNRLRILNLLNQKNLFVCEVGAILGLANSTVSKHLSILRDADLIIDKKEGRWVKYQINRESPNPYVQQMLGTLLYWLEQDESFHNDLRLMEKFHSQFMCQEKILS